MISTPLSKNYFVYNGAKPYEIGKGNPPQTKEIQKGKIYNGYTKVDDTWIPYMRGKRIKRFTTMWNGEYIKYGENLAAPRSEDIFFREKIFVRQTGDSIIATLDNGNVSNDTLHIIFSKNEQILSNNYLLGLLNSKLMTWIYQMEHPTEVNKPMAQVKKTFVEELPVSIGTQEQIEQIETIVSNLLIMCQKKYEQKKQFLNYIVNVYEPNKVSEQMESFTKLSFKEFINELKKQKVKLTAAQQMDLLSLYDEQKIKLEQISLQINELQSSLDDIVFSIYQIPQNISDMIKQNIQIEL